LSKRSNAIGFMNSLVQKEINVGLQGWNLVRMFILASMIPKVPQRKIHLLGTSLLLTSYVMLVIGQAQNLDNCFQNRRNRWARWDFLLPEHVSYDVEHTAVLISD
jgi:hypothetical protein